MPRLWRAPGLEETLGDPLRRSNVEMPVAEALLALVTGRMTMPHSQLGFFGWLREKVYARTGKDWSYIIFTAGWIFWLNRHHFKIEENRKANINWTRAEEDARRDLYRCHFRLAPLDFTVLLDGVHLAIMRANIDGAIGNCR
jgi:hypothetical protein